MSFEFEVVTSLCPKRNCTIPRYLVLWNELSGVKDLSDPPKGRGQREGWREDRSRWRRTDGRKWGGKHRGKSRRELKLLTLPGANWISKI